MIMTNSRSMKKAAFKFLVLEMCATIAFGQPSSLVNCASDDPEYCGCSEIPPSPSSDQCNDHATKEQAAVECFNFDDVNLFLQARDGSQSRQVQIEYRQQLYDVCYGGWGIQEAHTACRQLGFPEGAVHTYTSFIATENLTRSSFVDFYCNGDEDNLFSCVSKPPRNESCDDGLIVMLLCNGNKDVSETSSTLSTVSRIPDFEENRGEPTTQNYTTLFVQNTKETNTQFPPNKGSNSNVGLIVGGTLAAVFLIIIMVVIVIVAIKIGKRREINDVTVPVKVEEGTLYENQTFSADLDVDPYEDVDFAEYEDVMSSKWDIAFENLKLTGDILGKGNFGEVQLANVKIKGKWMVAAVKTLKQGTPETERMLFKEEFETMTKIGYHPNVVKILGSCEHEGSFYVILEYVHHGNLRKFLRTCRKEDKEAKLKGKTSMALTADQLLNFAVGVAKAMQHISACGVIHRDLAARNVLIGRGYTPKVADFGLSREDDIYVQTSSRRVPTRWLAIESMTRKTFSTKSDVWSFGILLWEIATFGGTPYPDMETKELAYQLNSGYRMPKPDNCQDDMYQLMLKCWHVDPDSRPSFEYIVDVLTDMASQDKIYMETPYTNASVLKFRYPAVCPEKDDK